MVNKYEPLTALLRAASARGQHTVELDFEAIAIAVGGLPPSSNVRQWWANNSQGQALAWRAAGFHVDFVSLDHKRVRFMPGEVGGSYHDHERVPAHPAPRRAPAPRERDAMGPPIDVRVRLQWLDAGGVTLDDSGKPVFAGIEASPGIYRMTFTGGDPASRPRVYIGESVNLQRRLAGNYRNPGPSQQTSLRINSLLRRQLTANRTVAVALATSVALWLDGTEQWLDLSRKDARLLAENAALVFAHVTDDADIENL